MNVSFYNETERYDQIFEGVSVACAGWDGSKDGFKERKGLVFRTLYHLPLRLHGVSIHSKDKETAMVSRKRVSATKKAKSTRNSKNRAGKAPRLEPINGDCEAWLSRAVQLLGPYVMRVASFEKIRLQRGIPVAGVICSWLPGKVKGLSHTIIRTDGPVILMSPIVGRGWADWDKEEGQEDHTTAALCLILHELIHIAVGLDVGHTGDFRKLALAVGLKRPLEEATPSDELHDMLIDDVWSRIGEYPGVSTKPETLDVPGARKQKNRQRKYVCANCGRIIRAAGEYLNATHNCDDGRIGAFELSD